MSDRLSKRVTTIGWRDVAIVIGVAAIYFAASGAVIWFDAILMAIAAILGGFAGAKIAHKLGRKFVRAAIVIIGLGMTIALFLKR